MKMSAGMLMPTHLGLEQQRAERARQQPHAVPLLVRRLRKRLGTPRLLGTLGRAQRLEGI